MFFFYFLAVESTVMIKAVRGDPRILQFPNHSFVKCKNCKEFVMQSLRNIQGTKDAGFEWYQLLSKIFTDLGWKPNTVCKGVWVYL